MTDLMNFLDAMIKQPPETIDVGSNKELTLSKEQRSGFKVACVVVKSMIEQDSSFVVTNGNKES